MSLESEIAALVTASNALTGEVSAKMAGIDAAVAAAIAAIPDLRRSVYVDAVTGDDNNPGTAALPVRTVGMASERVPVGGYGHIYLARNQDHVMDARAYDNKTILIWAAAEEPDNAYWALPSNTAPRLLVTGNQNLRNSHLFVGAYARCVDIRVNGGAFTSDIESTGLSAPGSTVGIAHSRITINHAWPLFSGNVPFMPGHVRIRYAEVVRPVAAPLINIPGNSSTVVVDFDALILPAGVTLADLVTGIIRDANGTPRNLLANFVI